MCLTFIDAAKIILLLCISSGFFTYIYFSFRFYYGFKKYEPKYNYKKKTVSIVVAARNEAENLVKLLTCFLNQNYPACLMEVIIADDDSEDNTKDVVESFYGKGLEIKYLKVQGRDSVISPKKNALEKAIAITSGELILTTDADCIVPSTWVESMVKVFTNDVAMVAGYSRTYVKDWAKSPLVHKYEHFDFALTYMVLAGGYTLGKSWACIGQNLAYSKAAFDAVEGFARIKHLISGDDVNLMQLMRKQGMKIVFNFDPAGFTYTKPVQAWVQLVNQRTRWASNMKYQLRSNPEFFFILLSMAFMYWGSLLVLMFNWKLAAGIFVLRLICELVFVQNNRKRFGITAKMMTFYPVWIVIQTFFLVFTMVLGQFNLFVWHGKKPYRRRINNVSNSV